MTALGAKGRPMPSEVWFDEENSTQATVNIAHANITSEWWCF